MTYNSFFGKIINPINPILHTSVPYFLVCWTNALDGSIWSCYAEMAYSWGPSLITLAACSPCYMTLWELKQHTSVIPVFLHSFLICFWIMQQTGNSSEWCNLKKPSHRRVLSREQSHTSTADIFWSLATAARKIMHPTFTRAFPRAAAAKFSFQREVIWELMTATHLPVVWQRNTDGVRYAQGTRQENRQSAICPLQHANLFNQIPQIPSCVPTRWGF